MIGIWERKNGGEPSSLLFQCIKYFIKQMNHSSKKKLNQSILLFIELPKVITRIIRTCNKI